MAARTRRGAPSSEANRENGRGGEGPSRKTIETIKDATGGHNLAAAARAGHQIPLGGHERILKALNILHCMRLAIVAGASEEDIMVMLQECSNDVNETTSRLIDSERLASPFRSSALSNDPQD